MGNRYGVCEACGQYRLLVEPGDHIVTRGAGGCDCPVNILQCCRRCHDRRHVMGVVSFYKQTPELWERYVMAKYHQYDRNKGLPFCSPKWARAPVA